ncbi:TlpA family protein disulfide reductase [Tenacibaculum agarivorans]|uniref:TlpA family protein disulfide reductase n=1 Tax=Tenacibaculum agarivorans TaxID=1908389 RepID=UPI00094BB77C|nr:TlpA disulfide reductase family protein [Tenacibaculum agarivorans]
MKYLFFVSFVAVLFANCASPKLFSEKALNEKLVTLERDSISLSGILEKNKGKKVFAQVFASYCPVSQDSFDDVLQFQKENPDHEFVFLSVDHTYHDWKNGLKYVKPKGQFYYIPKKGDGDLGQFLKLKSIPRFLKIDEQGNIEVFKASKVSDKLK